jgi:hypothetical protein
MKSLPALTIFFVLITSSCFVPAGSAATDDGFDLTSTLWARAVLEVPGFPVVLKWKMIGTDIMESGDQVVSGYFYADPDDFSYGSEYNPELFVKIYIDVNGWCNIAFNHVSVDPISIDSRHIRSASSVMERTGIATLSKRLVEHQYDDVAIDADLDSPELAPDSCNTYTSDLWAEAHIRNNKMMWKTVGRDTTPSGDQVISGYFYGDPLYLQDSGIYNPEVFVKIYISRTGWTNIAFNHVTVYDVEIASAHHYAGQADQTGTISLSSRLLEHRYEGVFASVGPETYDITVSTGRIHPILFGNPEVNIYQPCTMSVPDGGSQSYAIESPDGHYIKDILLDGTSVGHGSCNGYYTVQNVSKPTTLDFESADRIVGDHPLYGLNAVDVYVSGNYAYAVNLESGFSVINVSNPEDPAIVGWVDTRGEATGVSVSGDYAYVADGSAGFSIIDITDPERPAVAGRVELPGRTTDVYLAGGYVYAESDDNGLSAIDVSDPLNPTVAGWIGASETVDDVFVSGNFAYYLDDGDFQVVNITDPENPVAVGHTDAGNAYAIAVSGNYACAYSSLWAPDNFKVIDISDPGNPAVVGTTVVQGTYLFDFSVYGNYAYITYGYSYLVYREGRTPMTIVDITDPTWPIVAVSGGRSRSGRVHVSGDYAYLANPSSEDMDILDIHNPYNGLSLVGSVPDTGPESLYAAGDYLYVAHGIQGLLVMDLQDPAKPAIIGRVDTLGLAHYVHVDNKCAYVLNKGKGLVLVDVSDPGNPMLAGQVEMPGATEVDVSYPYAYVANDAAGLTIVNVMDPEKPVIVTSVDTPSQVYDVVVSGQYAYVGDNKAGLQVIDISEPENPVLVWGDGKSNSSIWEVGVYGGYAYIMNSVILSVWDLTDPENPSYAGLTSYFPIYDNFHFSGDFMFGTSEHFFGIYDITDPVTPIRFDSVSKSYYPTSYIVTTACVSNNYAYIGGPVDGLTIAYLGLCGL